VAHVADVADFPANARAEPDLDGCAHCGGNGTLQLINYGGPDILLHVECIAGWRAAEVDLAPNYVVDATR
jgi:hypothetical protein